MADLNYKLVFDQEDLVSGSVRQRQSIRSMAKGVHINFQLSRVVLNSDRFFSQSLERIARFVTSAPGSTRIR